MIMTIDNEPLKGNEPISATVERVWRQIGMDRLSPAEQERFLAHFRGLIGLWVTDNAARSAR